MSSHVFKNLLTKRITRKQFLVYLGILVLTVLGISPLIKSISNLDLTKRLRQPKIPIAQNGFGAGPYGA
jgi:hypothetical protein